MYTTVDVFNWTLVSSNSTYDFYICKCYTKGWYVRAILKDTDKMSAQAGFTTKRACLACIDMWMGWMR